MKKIVFLVLAGLVVFTACTKEVVITVKSNDESWGKVSGGGTYQKGEEIKLKATPTMSIYKFVKWEDGNTDNPRTIVVKKAATYTAVFEQSGGAPGPIYIISSFSVSDTTQVIFSPGNLQWSAKNGGSTATTHAVAGGGTAAGTWRFAPNQWDTIGANNKNISSTYSGWIDLFGWGTSGYNNKYPYMTSTAPSDYGNESNNISGTNYDWGVYNAIYNPVTQTTDAPGTWRTLTKDEWFYLINTRVTSSCVRYAKAVVNGINGLIIVPDDWNTSVYALQSTNTAEAAFTTNNNISSDDWTNMENAGCVFLPDSYSHGAYSLYFNSSSLLPSYNSSRDYGRSVRLVRNVQ